MRRSHYIALGAVVMLAAIFLSLSPRAASQIKLAIGGFFLPLFGLAGSGQQMAERAGNAVVPRKDLIEQNDRLRRENAELKVQLQRMGELERQNERMSRQLGFPQQVKWTMKFAHVTARDPANWWRNVWIDLGSRDGLRVDSPVLTSEGLVGRVSEVGTTRSRVVLIGDPSCRVSSLVYVPQTRETIDTGVITGGSGVLDESIVELGFLARASAVKPGQLVVTSGLGGIFPKGILVGQVIDTRPAEFGLVTVARVKLAVKMNLLEEVWVMMP